MCCTRYPRLASPHWWVLATLFSSASSTMKAAVWRASGHHGATQGDSNSYSVSVAPEIYRCKQHKLLAGLVTSWWHTFQTQPCGSQPISRLEQNSPEQEHVTGRSASAETGHGSRHGEPERTEDAHPQSSPASCHPPHPRPGLDPTPGRQSGTPGHAVSTSSGLPSWPPHRLNW